MKTLIILESSHPFYHVYIYIHAYIYIYPFTQIITSYLLTFTLCSHSMVVIPPVETSLSYPHILHIVHISPSVNLAHWFVKLPCMACTLYNEDPVRGRMVYNGIDLFSKFNSFTDFWIGSGMRRPKYLLYFYLLTAFVLRILYFHVKKVQKVPS